MPAYDLPPFALHQHPDVADEAPSVFAELGPPEAPPPPPPPPDSPEYPWYLESAPARQRQNDTWDLNFIPGGPHGDFQYGGGSTEELIGVQADNTFLSVLHATPLGNGVARLHWQIPNAFKYSWLALTRSLFGRPVSLLESRILYVSPRSTAYATFVDAALPHGREVCYSLFLLTTDAIPRWVRTASTALVTANDPFMTNVFREQLPEIYWERDLLQAEEARLPGNDHARSSDGQLWRFFDLISAELTTSKALFDALVSMRDPLLVPSALLGELAKLIGGYEFVNLPEERLREVLANIIANRKNKGTGAAYAAVLGGMMNCPVELLRTKNWILDVNSSQEFYPTQATASPGYWWPGSASMGVFQVLNTEAVDNDIADTTQPPGTIPEGNHVFLGTWTSVGTAGAVSAGKIHFDGPNDFTFHEIDDRGVDISVNIESMVSGTTGFYVLAHRPDTEAIPATGTIARVGSSSIFDAHRSSGAGPLNTWPVGTRVTVALVRPLNADPTPLSGTALLAAGADPNAETFVIRSVPPIVDTDPVRIRDFGIPVEPGHAYLFSVYVVSKGESVRVEAVIEFWNDKGIISADALTDRTYRSMEEYYRDPDLSEGDYENIDSDPEADEYLDLLLDPVAPTPGSAPGTILKSEVLDTEIFAPPGEATWVRPYVIVVAPLQADRLVLRLYGVGPNSQTVLYADQFQLEKLTLSDLPLDDQGFVDWDLVEPTDYEPARSVNVIVHPYRRNMVRNPRAIGTSTTTFKVFRPTVGTITTIDPGPLPPELTLVMETNGPAQDATIVSQWENDPSRSWMLRRSATTGALSYDTYDVGTDAVTQRPTLSTSIADGRELLAVSVRFNDGGQTSVTLWRSPDRGSTWNEIGALDEIPTVLVQDVSSVMRIGSHAGGAAGVFDGDIFSVEQRTGLDPAGGTVQWRFDADDYPGGGVTSYVDPRGRIWNLSTSTAISEVSKNTASFWDSWSEPSGGDVQVTVASTHDATGYSITALHIDYPTPPFGVSTVIGPDLTKFIYSMVGVKFSLFPLHAGRVMYRVMVEYCTGPDEDHLQVVDFTTHFDTFVGTIWTYYFHSFEVMVPKDSEYWIRVSIGPYGMDARDEEPPDGWEFHLTEILVDDLTDDLPYFDGDSNTVDQEFGWLATIAPYPHDSITLGTEHASPSGAWPRRLRREENIDLITDNWLPMLSHWTIRYADGRFLYRTVRATGAYAGTPGAWLPPGARVPKTLDDLQRQTVTPSPYSKWLTDQHVVLGNGAHTHWDGNSWEAGDAP